MLTSLLKRYETSISITCIYDKTSNILHIDDDLYKLLENNEFEIFVGYHYLWNVEKHSKMIKDHMLYFYRCDIRCSLRLKAKIKLMMD